MTSNKDEELANLKHFTEVSFWFCVAMTILAAIASGIIIYIERYFLLFASLYTFLDLDVQRWSADTQ